MNTKTLTKEAENNKYHNQLRQALLYGVGALLKIMDTKIFHEL